MKMPLLAATALTLMTLSAYAKTDVTIGMVLEPPNLDPTGGAAAAIDEVVYANVYEGLTRFGSDGAILPALAKDWSITADGMTYTFNLNSGVSFHDGTAFDAEDVKFSLDRARADDSTNAQKALFADIASVEVVNPATVKVTLSKPNGSFLFNMAWGDAVIVAPESIDNAASEPVGTGPFRFSKWIKGDSVVLEKNETYWGNEIALDKATFKFIADPTAAFAAVMAGDVDAFPNFPATENLPQFDADPRFEVVVGSTEGETILSTNNKRAPFDNMKVRKAIAHAIDRKAIIDGAMFGYGTPIGTHFAPHNPAYVDLTEQSNYDPERAKALLVEAGFADGFKATLKLPPPAYARRGGEIIAAQLRKVGIELEIINMEWAQWLEGPFRGKDFDLTIVSHTEPMDIGIYGRDDYYFQYADPDFKAIMTDLNNATDPELRTELMQKAQRKIADDYVNGYLFQLARTGVSAKGLKGLWKNAPTQANDLTGVFWE
ncbi:MAG: ABC transporter substrate-binding protein [Pseudomonadota bacterium]